MGDHAQDPERHHAGARRRVVADDDAVERARVGGARRGCGARSCRCRSGRSRAPCSVATSESISRSLIDVVPPLMWPTTWGSASSTTSALIGFEPAMDGPPVWMVTVIPCCFAQRTMGAASFARLHRAEPDLADQLHARARHLGEVLLDHAPARGWARRACIFTPGGAEVRVGLRGDDGERLEADDVLRATGQVHLAGRDHGRDAAVEARLDEVHRALARREVAEHGMAVRVDEAGDDRGAPRRRSRCRRRRRARAPPRRSCRRRSRWQSPSRSGRAMSPETICPMFVISVFIVPQTVDRLRR